MSTVPVEEGKKGKGRPAYKGNPTATPRPVLYRGPGGVSIKFGGVFYQMYSQCILMYSDVFCVYSIGYCILMYPDRILEGSLYFGRDTM